MKTIITLPKKQKKTLPEDFKGNDDRFSEFLVEYFLKEYTEKGDKVLDIFAGYGTTLFVAEDMGRVPYGIEYDRKRYDYIREKLENKENIVNGDALKLLDYNLPKCDFFLTSPQYMTKGSETNPFTSYTTPGNYEKYLKDYEKIFNQVKKVMKPNSKIVIELANINNEGEVTPLAWDVGKKISKVFNFKGEVIIKWDGEEEPTKGTYGYGYDHSYCLIFSNK